MVSHPQYNPASLASHNLTSVQAAWKALNADPARPAVNRAIAGDLYPPGSTFKLVTAAAALSSGKYTEDSVVPGPASLDLPLTTTNLPNDDGLPCGPGNQSTLTRALERSCNSTFGGLGLKLGADALRTQAAKFGFGDVLRVPMRVSPSSVPDKLNAPQLAQSAIGQYDVRVTPLQMAMVSAAIANRGVVMSPYLVQTVRGSNLDVIDRTSPEQLSQAVSPDVAAQLTRMMEKVVTSGTGTAAQIPGSASRARRAPPSTPRAPHPTRGSPPSPRPTTPRSPSPSWSRTAATSATRPSAAASPRRSRVTSSRR